jgi:NAD(P)-dependent dehydrogenase (short-subunit alcohol dehydrogenase family)
VTALGGKRVLVTGAGLGIGQAIARELALQGASVCIHTSATAPDETLALVRAAGADAVAVSGDLAQVADCWRVVDEAADALGGLDVLVNNAGITRELAFDDTSPEVFAQLFDLNVRGYFVCSQRALRHFGARASIVNVSSIHAHAGLPRHAAYAATKGAINSLTRALAVELAPRGVRVNGIGPGVVEVPRFRERAGYSREGYGASIPAGRVGQPGDIGPVAAFLVSDAADFLTGQIVYIDGGSTARLSFYRDPL